MEIADIIDILFIKFSQLIKLVSPIFTTTLMVFYLFVTYMFITITIPYYFRFFSSYWFIPVVLLLFGLFFIFCLFFNFVLAVVVKPGNVKDIKLSKRYQNDKKWFYDIDEIDFSFILNKEKLRLELILSQECIDNAYEYKSDEDSLNVGIEVINDIENVKVNKISDTNANTNNTGLSFCKLCNLYKPLRAHHCSICRICVLKMDHHCPWVSNCVGQNNGR